MAEAATPPTGDDVELAGIVTMIGFLSGKRKIIIAPLTENSSILQGGFTISFDAPTEAPLA